VGEFSANSQHIAPSLWFHKAVWGKKAGRESDEKGGEYPLQKPNSPESAPKNMVV